MKVGHQFITVTVYICVQYDGPDALRRAGLLAAAETCFVIPAVNVLSIFFYKTWYMQIYHKTNLTVNR